MLYVVYVMLYNIKNVRKGEGSEVRRKKVFHIRLVQTPDDRTHQMQLSAVLSLAPGLVVHLIHSALLLSNSQTWFQVGISRLSPEWMAYLERAQWSNLANAETIPLAAHVPTILGRGSTHGTAYIFRSHVHLTLSRLASAVNVVGLSRKHAEITRTNGDKWVIRDLKSLNGVYVNGRKVETANLS